MSKQDALMFALYLIAIAAGTQMHFPLNVLQVVLCAALFAFRLYIVFKRIKLRERR